VASPTLDPQECDESNGSNMENESRERGEENDRTSPGKDSSPLSASSNCLAIIGSTHRITLSPGIRRIETVGQFRKPQRVNLLPCLALIVGAILTFIQYQPVKKRYFSIFVVNRAVFKSERWETTWPPPSKRTK
jgi:hypothetical protein